MTVTKLENLVLRNVVVAVMGENVELCFGITGQVTKQPWEHSSLRTPSLNPWNSAPPSAVSAASAYMPDALPDASEDGQGLGAGRPLGLRRTFGSRPGNGSRPLAGEQTVADETFQALGADGLNVALVVLHADRFD